MKKILLTSVLMGVMFLSSGICKADITQDIAGDYKGNLTIDLGAGEGPGDPIPDQKVSIVIEDNESKVRFTLYDFNFGEIITNEDIVLDGVPVTEAPDGTLTIGNDDYSKNLALGTAGVIKANVKFDSENSYIDGDKILVSLNIQWETFLIKVNFDGEKVTTSIVSGKNTPTMKFDNAANLLIAPETQDANYTICNVSGTCVKSGSFVNGTATVDGLSGGIYFVKSGATVIKIVKK